MAEINDELKEKDSENNNNEGSTDSGNTGGNTDSSSGDKSDEEGGGTKKKESGIITEPMRKAIKKIAEISQCARALSLMPTPEDFALMLIDDLKIIVKKMNSITSNINAILDKYASIPVEFLLKGFDEILNRLRDAEDYVKFAISETADLLNNSVNSVKETATALKTAASEITSATIEVGGGVAYGVAAMSANIRLVKEGNGRRKVTQDMTQDVIDGKVSISEYKAEVDKLNKEVDIEHEPAEGIKQWTETATNQSKGSIDEFFKDTIDGFDNAINIIDNAKKEADGVVDETLGAAIKKVENAKREVEERIKKVKEIFEDLIEDFEDAFGFMNVQNLAEDIPSHVSTVAGEIESEVFKELSSVSNDVSNFIKNFNIAKVISAFGGLVAGAGIATLAMDLLPNIDVDKMLKDIIGGVNREREDKFAKLKNNKVNADAPELFEVPGVPWQLSVDDLEKYNPEGYKNFLNKYSKENDKTRNEILEQMKNVKTSADLAAVSEANREKMKENKSALKEMRKVRRDAIKARMVDRYKGFLRVELEDITNDFNEVKNKITYRWDTMMSQYKESIKEISRFFSKEGCGGNEIIDKCCDRINSDAKQIVEMCKSISVELTNAVAMVPTPYAVGACVDMPVHKILAFIKDIKIIVTFLKNLIALGIDIISQLTILTKMIFNGIQSLVEILQMLKKLIGVDFILDMINCIVALFKPKMLDAKLLLENAISPIYFNETPEYEKLVETIENYLESETNTGLHVGIIKYTEDKFARKKYLNKSFGGKIYTNEEEIEDLLDEIEEKGEREIVAYRSPILNSEGDDFAGWIYYHAYAYGKMKRSWSKSKKRRRNKAIKKASKKNKMRLGKLVGGVADLKRNKKFGEYNEKGKYIKNSVTAYDAYYWYTKWTSDPTDCDPDYTNTEDSENFQESVVAPVQTTSNGSLVELSDGRRVFVEGKIVKSGDFVNVEGKKYRVK